MSAKPLPCPWCRKPPKLFGNPDNPKAWCSTKDGCPLGENDGWMTPEEWNRRTPPPATAGLIERWRHEIRMHRLLRTGNSSMPVDMDAAKAVVAEWA